MLQLEPIWLTLIHGGKCHGNVDFQPVYLNGDIPCALCLFRQLLTCCAELYDADHVRLSDYLDYLINQSQYLGGCREFDSPSSQPHSNMDKTALTCSYQTTSCDSFFSKIVTIKISKGVALK
jgi:hypothetical protein